MNIAYKNELEETYKKKSLRIALDICKSCAETYLESYYTGPDFEPHPWVLAAVCEALEDKKWWKAFDNLNLNDND